MQMSTQYHREERSHKTKLQDFATHTHTHSLPNLTFTHMPQYPEIYSRNIERIFQLWKLFIKTRKNGKYKIWWWLPLRHHRLCCLSHPFLAHLFLLEMLIVSYWCPCCLFGSEIFKFATRLNNISCFLIFNIFCFYILVGRVECQGEGGCYFWFLALFIGC